MAIFFSSPQYHPDHYTILQKLGLHSWNKAALLKMALTHSSYLNENPDENLECNERLEFLGDAALDLAIAEELHNDDDALDEGEMTLIRSKVVDTKTLARAARSLNLGEYLLMGSGEAKSGGRNRNSNLAGAFEAVVGAIFSDKGYNAARDFCIRTLNDEIDDAYDKVTAAPEQPQKPADAKKTTQTAKSAAVKQPKKSQNPSIAGKHPKSALQEISQAEHGEPPVYRITKATGKSNAMTFTAQVQVDCKTLGSGTGSSKKAAETAAAEAALGALAKNG